MFPPSVSTEGGGALSEPLSQSCHRYLTRVVLKNYRMAPTQSVVLRRVRLSSEHSRSKTLERRARPVSTGGALHITLSVNPDETFHWCDGCTLRTDP